MPVTGTEVTFRFRRPPRDIFVLAPLPPSNGLRFRVWPETEVSLTLAGKRPGAGGNRRWNHHRSLVHHKRADTHIVTS
jgi:glucose-6-phosphate 1-dehydrogenase